MFKNIEVGILRERRDSKKAVQIPLTDIIG